MKTNSKFLGLVTKKFNDFFLVDLKNMGCLFKQIQENEKFIKIQILNEN